MGNLDTVCPSEPVPANEGMASPLGLLSSEYWLVLSPASKSFIFREYNLRTGSDVALTGQRVMELVGQGQYPEAEFGFEHFEPLRSSVYPDRGFVTTDHLLHSEESNLLTLVNDSFARILRRPLSVTVSDQTIGVRFNGSGLRVAENNSLGVFAQEDDLVVCFRNGASSYEMVVAQVGDTSGVSLAPAIPETILFESPAFSR